MATVVGALRRPAASLPQSHPLLLLLLLPLLLLLLLLLLLPLIKVLPLLPRPPPLAAAPGRSRVFVNADPSTPSAALLSAAFQQQWMLGPAPAAAARARSGRAMGAAAQRSEATEPAPPSLAELLGVAASSPSAPSAPEWAAAEAACRARASASDCCAICCERLWLDEQLLLSCSHTLHRTCLANMERFAPQHAQRTCPVCRARGYHTKVLVTRSDALRHRAAMRSVGRSASTPPPCALCSAPLQRR